MDTVTQGPAPIVSPDQSDIGLLRRVVVGDHQAFERLYQRYTPRLSAYLRKLLGSHEPIEDVLHDVFLVVWQRAAQYRSTGRVSTWLFGIARYKALQARARATRFPSSPEPTSEPIDTTDPAHRMAHRDRVRQVRQALDALSPMHREVFVLTYECGYSAQKIAALQECSTSTVHYRKQQVRHHLAIRLGLSV